MTIAGDIQTVLKDANLLASDPDLAIRNRVYLVGHVPANPRLPYLTVNPIVGDAPRRGGDARITERDRLVQVSSWEDRASESEALGDAIQATLDGAVLPARTYRCRLVNIVRQDDAAAKIVQRSYDCLCTYRA